MSCYKRVVYMDYHENGERISNAGFVKLLRMRSTEGGLARKTCRHQQEWTCMQIHALNLPQRNDLWGNVKLVRDGREILIGRMMMEAGRGMQQIKNLEEICEDWEKWRLKIEMTPAGNVWCDLGANARKEEERERDEEEAGRRLEEELECRKKEEQGRKSEEELKIRRKESTGTKRSEGLTDWMEGEWTSGNDEQWDDQLEEGVVKKPDEERRDAENEPCGQPGYVEKRSETEQDREQDLEQALERERKQNQSGGKCPHTSARMKRDKWQQLCTQLPHTHPFQDEREYLQLNLQDMLVLSAKHYRLVENSFLLHGFYNYEHLILTRVQRRGAEKYYLGVPGNYYEREKQVAVWFGFESFEPKTEPASEGDFGYYMISVDI